MISDIAFESTPKLNPEKLFMFLFRRRWMILILLIHRLLSKFAWWRPMITMTTLKIPSWNLKRHKRRLGIKSLASLAVGEYLCLAKRRFKWLFQKPFHLLAAIAGIKRATL